MLQTAVRKSINVVVWGENRHEQTDSSIAARYPDGMHGAIKQGIEEYLGAGASVSTVTLDDPEHGLTEELLAATDVPRYSDRSAHADSHPTRRR